jgi:hypothetical protein
VLKLSEVRSSHSIKIDHIGLCSNFRMVMLPTVFVPFAQSTYANVRAFENIFPTDVIVKTHKPLLLQHSVEHALR